MEETIIGSLIQDIWQDKIETKEFSYPNIRIFINSIKEFFSLQIPIDANKPFFWVYMYTNGITKAWQFWYYMRSQHLYHKLICIGDNFWSDQRGYTSLCICIPIFSPWNTIYGVVIELIKINANSIYWDNLDWFPLYIVVIGFTINIQFLCIWRLLISIGITTCTHMIRALYSII